ncbi:uncharacterized protein LOC126985019 [Eriocheir sinensis]|uniref:uncharacterized protein LOC126985019 n=1 Tax=Eriocheir sinensis TaxID=95602 RepID=UPI0021C8A186|nr:uncharacterized protein LOC126985019 [Eriocheir sinensis]
MPSAGAAARTTLPPAARHCWGHKDPRRPPRKTPTWPPPVTVERSRRGTPRLASSTASSAATAFLGPGRGAGRATTGVHGVRRAVGSEASHCLFLRPQRCRRRERLSRRRHCPSADYEYTEDTDDQRSSVTKRIFR